MIRIVPNIQNIVERVGKLMSTPSCCQVNLELDINPEYSHILNMWNFFKGTSELYHKMYHKVNLGKSEINDIYKKYFNRHPIIKDCFESHIKCNTQHLILFYIKGCDTLLLLYKNPKAKLLPFVQIKIPFSNFDENTRNKLYNDIGYNHIKMLFFV
tara:strand:+ start:1304 stop:1771 length:468 start_codon:yes stop_codon:yes gene_type:complete